MSAFKPSMSMVPPSESDSSSYASDTSSNASSTATTTTTTTTPTTTRSSSLATESTSVASSEAGANDNTDEGPMRNAFNTTMARPALNITDDADEDDLKSPQTKSRGLAALATSAEKRVIETMVANQTAATQPFAAGDGPRGPSAVEDDAADTDFTPPTPRYNDEFDDYSDDSPVVKDRGLAAAEVSVADNNADTRDKVAAVVVPAAPVALTASSGVTPVVITTTCTVSAAVNKSTTPPLPSLMTLTDDTSAACDAISLAASSLQLATDLLRKETDAGRTPPAITNLQSHITDKRPAVPGDEAAAAMAAAAKHLQQALRAVEDSDEPAGRAHLTAEEQAMRQRLDHMRIGEHQRQSLCTDEDTRRHVERLDEQQAFSTIEQVFTKDLESLEAAAALSAQQQQQAEASAPQSPVSSRAPSSAPPSPPRTPTTSEPAEISDKRVEATTHTALVDSKGAGGVGTAENLHAQNQEAQMQEASATTVTSDRVTSDSDTFEKESSSSPSSSRKSSRRSSRTASLAGKEEEAPPLATAEDVNHTEAEPPLEAPTEPDTPADSKEEGTDPQPCERSPAAEGVAVPVSAPTKDGHAKEVVPEEAPIQSASSTPRSVPSARDNPESSDPCEDGSAHAEQAPIPSEPHTPSRPPSTTPSTSGAKRLAPLSKPPTPSRGDGSDASKPTGASRVAELRRRLQEQRAVPRLAKKRTPVPIPPRITDVADLFEDGATLRLSHQDAEGVRIYLSTDRGASYSLVCTTTAKIVAVVNLLPGTLYYATAIPVCGRYEATKTRSILHFSTKPVCEGRPAGERFNPWKAAAAAAEIPAVTTTAADASNSPIKGNGKPRVKSPDRPRY